MKKIYKNVECVKLKSSWLFKRRTTLETFLNQKLNVKKNCDLKKYVVQIFLLDAQKSSKIFVSRKFFC